MAFLSSEGKHRDTVTAGGCDESIELTSCPAKDLEYAPWGDYSVVVCGVPIHTCFLLVAVVSVVFYVLVYSYWLAPYCCFRRDVKRFFL